MFAPLELRELPRPLRLTKPKSRAQTTAVLPLTPPKDLILHVIPSRLRSLPRASDRPCFTLRLNLSPDTLLHSLPTHQPQCLSLLSCLFLYMPFFSYFYGGLLVKTYLWWWRECDFEILFQAFLAFRRRSTPHKKEGFLLIFVLAFRHLFYFYLGVCSEFSRSAVPVRPGSKDGRRL